MKRIAVMIIGVAMMLMMALAMTGCGKNDAQTLENTRPQVTSTQKADGARKAEEAKKLESAKKAEEAKKVEAAKKAEEAKKLEAAKKADEAKKVEAAKKAEEAKKAAEAQKAAEAANNAPVEAQPVVNNEENTVMKVQSTGSPVQRYSGVYTCDRCRVEITRLSNNTVAIKVVWGNSAFDRCEWTMTGNFDADGTTLQYIDGTKKILTYGTDGYLKNTKTLSMEEKGSFFFDGETMTWADLAENAAAGMTFQKVV